jgi:hypothetical protein
VLQKAWTVVAVTAQMMRAAAAAEIAKAAAAGEEKDEHRARSEKGCKEQSTVLQPNVSSTIWLQARPSKGHNSVTSNSFGGHGAATKCGTEPHLSRCRKMSKKQFGKTVQKQDDVGKCTWPG